MEYNDKVMRHYKVQNEIALSLLWNVIKICPEDWVVQILPTFDDKKKEAFLATVTNGDDNVTAVNKNLCAALSQLLYYLFDGSVFPLTGGDGKHYYPGDTGWTKEK